MTDDGRGQAPATDGVGPAVPEPTPTLAEGIGTCRCPGTPHPGGETVRFRPAATTEMGAAAMSSRREAENADEYVGVLAPIELRFGIEWWTCQGPNGPLPIRTENIAERFPWADGGYELSEMADALYSSDIVRPLAERIRRSSSGGPTAPPTPPIPGSGQTPPEGSGPSSPAPTGTSPSEAPAP